MKKGLSLHLFTAFKEIVEQDLVMNGFYEIIDNVHLPNLVYCLDFNEKDIDDNFKLNGNYLNQVTKNLSKETVFKKINTFAKKSSNFTKNVRIYEFYFQNLKCFEIELDRKIKFKDFYLSPPENIIEISFNEEILERKNLVYFSYKERNYKIPPSFTRYRIGNLTDGTAPIYFIELESMGIKREDKFETLKQLRSLFYEKIFRNDVNDYLTRLEKKFEKIFIGLTTKEIILNEENHGVEIDDELWKQYYLQVISHT